MKEKIEDFDIELDITDCEQIYDYATCQYVRREPGLQWDREQLKSLGVITSDALNNESLMMQINLMDKTINKKGLLQQEVDENSKGKPGKEADESIFGPSFENFTTSLDLPRRALPVYQPGDIVKGHVVLKLNQEITPDALLINFLGEGFTNIRVYHRYGYSDYHGHDTYVDDTKKLWVNSGKAKDVSDSFSTLLTAESSEPQVGPQLGQGNHSFFFEFTIPMQTSQSTPNLHPSSAHYCYIIYRLKAKLDSGNAFGSGDIVTNKGIWVVKRNDIGNDLENFEPVLAEETLETGVIIKSGKVSVKANLPKKGYLLGDSVPLSLEVDNQTSSEIDEVKAYIALHGKYRTSTKWYGLSKKINVKAEKVKLGPIASGMCPSFNINLSWDFTCASVDNNLMPTGTLDDCELIDVKYDVLVKIKRKGMHRNMELQMPIVVGNYNSRE